MIQFNLLPDVKLNYVKANRLKHTITIVSIFVAGAAVAIMILLFLSVYVAQKVHMNSLRSQITSTSNQLKKTPNLNEVLTVQEEVNALPALNAQNPITTRLSGYISQITPTTVTISHLNINFTTNVITITGSTSNLANVNQFVDTLKQSNYQTTTNSTPQNAFTNVVLSNFSYVSSSGASYTITASFDPAIFSQNSNSVTLNVPSNGDNRTSSGGSALFQPQPTTSSSTTNPTSN